MNAKYQAQRESGRRGGNGVPPNGSGRAAASEKRQAVRSTFDIQVGVSSHHRIFVGLMSNISTGGLFLATDEELSKGDRVEVRFQIPGSDYVFHKQAEVCWTRPYDEHASDADARAGAGVRLDDLTDDEKRMLNAFIDVHEPMFFEA